MVFMDFQGSSPWITQKCKAQDESVRKYQRLARLRLLEEHESTDFFQQATGS
jgi:hypothetical protein